MLKRLQDGYTRVMYGKEKKILKEAFYQLFDKDMDGKEVPMDTFKGDVLLVVNLIDEYGKEGLKVLAFPCNQFASQEPGTHEEILKFVDGFFPHEKASWFEKADVNGANAREVFSFLKQKLPNSDGSTDIRWNFAKFLVDHEGTPYKRFGPKTPPLSMKDDIEFLLKKKNEESK